jgi:hypothetical protein
MKRVLIYLALALAVVGTAVHAQNAGISRLEKQHGPTRFEKNHLKQAEATLLLSLDSTWKGDQTAAIQDVRYLAELFPAYPFPLLIEPLGKILRNKNADPIARRLAALALDDLHSDSGDAIIHEVANTPDDKGLAVLCKALQVGDETWKKLAAKK